jgi:hypothetical protein
MFAQFDNCVSKAIQTGISKEELIERIEKIWLNLSILQRLLMM